MTEVDFIVGDMNIAIEAKSTQNITSDHMAGLRSLSKEFASLKSKIIVCLERQRRLTEDGILILPYQEFAQMLWDGELIP